MVGSKSIIAHVILFEMAPVYICLGFVSSCLCEKVLPSLSPFFTVKEKAKEERKVRKINRDVSYLFLDYLSWEEEDETLFCVRMGKWVEVVGVRVASGWVVYELMGTGRRVGG